MDQLLACLSFMRAQLLLFMFDSFMLVVGSILTQAGDCTFILSFGFGSSFVGSMQLLQEALIQ